MALITYALRKREADLWSAFQQVSPCVLRAVQAVAAVMNQLCVRFPMVAAHNTTSAFAVACPEARLPDTRAALTALQAPLNIYNMSTGVKTHVLVFSRAQASGRGGTVATNPLLPILKVRCAAAVCFTLMHVVSICLWHACMACSSTCIRSCCCWGDMDRCELHLSLIHI